MKWAEERVLCQKTSLSFEHIFSEHLLQARHCAGPGDDSGDGSGTTPPGNILDQETDQGGHLLIHHDQCKGSVDICGNSQEGSLTCLGQGMKHRRLQEINSEKKRKKKTEINSETQNKVLGTNDATEGCRREKNTRGRGMACAEPQTQRYVQNSRYKKG